MEKLPTHYNGTKLLAKHTINILYSPRSKKVNATNNKDTATYCRTRFIESK